MSNILVLINPLKSCGHYETKDSRGVPSLEQVRELTDAGIRVVFVDNMINREIKDSVLDKHPGHLEMRKLKSEHNINPLLHLANNRPSFWDWVVHDDKDLREESEDTVIYVDYSKYYQEQADLPDDLVVMSQVCDFKYKNRAYLRNVPYGDLFGLFSQTPIANNYFDYFDAVNIVVHKEVYEILLRSLRCYISNEFFMEDAEFDFGGMETNIIKEPSVTSYAFVLSHPMLKGFVHYNKLLPDIPKNDHMLYKGVGLTPTKMMTESNQYRREMTKRLAVFMARLLVRDKVMPVGKNWYSVETIDEAITALYY